MKFYSALEAIGFSKKEIDVYLCLVEHQEALASTIARKTNIKRSTVYAVIDKLKSKGVVSHFKKKGSLYFRALNPEALLEDQHNKYKALELAVPELINLHEKYLVTPQMEIYEGKEGLIKIMEDTLTTSTELLCWADIERATDYLSDYYPTYVRKKVERNLWLRGVFFHSQTALDFKKNSKKELREVYLVPREKFPFKNEINIYDDKVAIVSYEDQVGVIIQNKNIADTQRAIFELGFEYAKKISK